MFSNLVLRKKKEFTDARRTTKKITTKPFSKDLNFFRTIDFRENEVGLDKLIFIMALIVILNNYMN